MLLVGMRNHAHEQRQPGQLEAGLSGLHHFVSPSVGDAYAALRTLSINLKHTRDPPLLLETFVADVRAKRRATDEHYRRRWQ